MSRSSALANGVVTIALFALTAGACGPASPAPESTKTLGTSPSSVASTQASSSTPVSQSTTSSALSLSTGGASPGSAWTHVNWQPLPTGSPLATAIAIETWHGGHILNTNGQGDWTSTDGQSWTRLPAPATSDEVGPPFAQPFETQTGLVDLGYDPADPCAFARSGCAVKYTATWTSSDGIAWKKAGPPGQFQNVAQPMFQGSPAGVLAVGKTVNTNNFVGVFSRDGIDWSTSPMPAGLTPTALTYGASRFIVFGTLAGNTKTVVFTSVDGRSWTLGQLPTATPALLRIEGLLVGRDAVIANAFSIDGDHFWLRSSDGATWQLADPPAGHPASGVSLRADGTRFLADDGVTLWTSFDGQTWTQLTQDGVRGESPDGQPVGCLLMPRGVIVFGASYGAAS